MRWTKEGLEVILNLRLVKYANPDHYCEFFDDLLNRSTKKVKRHELPMKSLPDRILLLTRFTNNAFIVVVRDTAYEPRDE